MEYLIYTSPTCQPCRNAKRLLTERGFTYTERDITDPEHKDFLVSNGLRTVPQIWQIESGERHYIGGYDDLKARFGVEVV